jgi:hypothetical protein
MPMAETPIDTDMNIAPSVRRSIVSQAATMTDRGIAHSEVDLPKGPPKHAGHFCIR